MPGRVDGGAPRSLRGRDGDCILTLNGGSRLEAWLTELAISSEGAPWGSVRWGRGTVGELGKPWASRRVQSRMGTKHCGLPSSSEHAMWGTNDMRKRMLESAGPQQGPRIARHAGPRVRDTVTAPPEGKHISVPGMGKGKIAGLSGRWC